MRRLQKVLSSALSTSRHGSPMIWHCAENLEVRVEVLAKRHDTCDIAASIAVIGRRPHRHYVLGGEVVLVALVDKLMRSSDEREIVDVVELDRNVRNGIEEGRERMVHTSELTLSPNSQPAPRGDTAQVSTSSGSLHTRSQKAPSCGISCARATTLIWSRVLISGERPP